MALAGVLILVGTAAAALSKKLTVTASYCLIPLLVGLLSGAEPALLLSGAAEGVAQFFRPMTTLLLSAAFFCGLAETGLFDWWLEKLLKDRALSTRALLGLTVACSAAIMLSGSITACYLVILPAFAPLYAQKALDRRVLLTLVSAVSGLGLLLPWSSKVLLLSGVSGAAPASLWKNALPLQAFGLLCCFALSALYALRARKRAPKRSLPCGALPFPERPFARKKPWQIAVNSALFLLCAALLTTGLSAPLVLLLALTVFFLLNFPNPAEQSALLKKVVAPVCPMALILLSVGVLLGVLDSAGMTDAMAQLLVRAIPERAARYAPMLVMAAFTPLLSVFHYHSLYAAVPLFLALLPGADAARATLPFLLLYPTCCSPMTALTQLACRTVGEEPLRFTRFALLPLCALSWASLLFGWAAGLFF